MEDYSDPAKRRRMEYATQFFGYTPDSLVDTLIGDVTDIVTANLKAAKKHILDKFAGRVDEHELEESFVRVQERQVESAEKVYFRFGSYLKDKILTVPEGVLLPEDAAHAAGASAASADGADLKAEMERFELLCSRAKEMKMRKAALEANRENLRALLARQERSLQRVRHIRERVKVQDAVDGEANKLEKRMTALRPLVEKIENNLNRAQSTPPRAGGKRGGAAADLEAAVEKKFKADDE